MHRSKSRSSTSRVRQKVGAMKQSMMPTKGIADGPTSIEVDRIEDKSKGKGRKNKGKGGILVAVLVDEVVESQKVSARKVVVEAKTKEASRRARKERPKMDRTAKRQVLINAKLFWLRSMGWRMPTTYGCERCAKSIRHQLYWVPQQQQLSFVVLTVSSSSW